MRLIGREDEDPSAEEIALLVLVTRVLNRHGVDLIGPVADLAYFDRLREEYERSGGTREGLEAWLDAEIPKRFRASRLLPLSAAGMWLVAIQADVIGLLAALELRSWWLEHRDRGTGTLALPTA